MQSISEQTRVTADAEALHAMVVETIERERGALIALSKFIHSHPEIAMQEVVSSEACAAFLEERGFAVERGIAGLPTAFRATVGSAPPTIAYLAEYDALP